jgi:hypothetical protein
MLFLPGHYFPSRLLPAAGWRTCRGWRPRKQFCSIHHLPRAVSAPPAKNRSEVLAIAAASECRSYHDPSAGNFDQIKS